MTRIIATIGPASFDETVIRALIENGMDMARLNFAWGDEEEHVRLLNRIRTIAGLLGKNIPIICDLPGPRTQSVEGHRFGGSEVVVTEEDKRGAELALKQHADYIAQSYVGDAHDIASLRTLIQNAQGRARIIAKVERAKAIDHIDEIITAADVIMVARGDLGQEVPLEKIPFIEQEIITRAHAGKKPVVVATDMMPSMIEHREPTRSDVTDVAFAVLAHADAVMLSNETAIGTYPVETVMMMRRIITESEQHASIQRIPFPF